MTKIKTKEECNITLTRIELANIINILSMFIYRHEQKEVQDIITIMNRLKNILKGDNNNE